MGERIPKTLVSGCVSLLVLSLLHEKDMYTSELTKSIQERTDGNIAPRGPSIISLAQHLQTQGYITSTLELHNSRTRRTFIITQKGVEELNRQRAFWETFYTSVNKLLDGPPDGANA